MREAARPANGCWAMRSGGKSYWNSETSIEEIIGFKVRFPAAAYLLASCGVSYLQAENPRCSDAAFAGSRQGRGPRHHTIQSIYVF